MSVFGAVNRPNLRGFRGSIVNSKLLVGVSQLIPLKFNLTDWFPSDTIHLDESLLIALWMMRKREEKDKVVLPTKRPVSVFNCLKSPGEDEVTPIPLSTNKDASCSFLQDDYLFSINRRWSLNCQYEIIRPSGLSRSVPSYTEARGQTYKIGQLKRYLVIVWAILLLGWFVPYSSDSVPKIVVQSRKIVT